MLILNDLVLVHVYYKATSILLKLSRFHRCLKTCYFELNILPQGLRTPTHPLNKMQAQEHVCLVILQYLFEMFKDEVYPNSSVERVHVDDDPSWKILQKSTKSFQEISLWQLLYSYLLSDICTMSQGRTTTKNKHLPPHLLDRSRDSQSVTQGDGSLWLGHLLWFRLPCPNNTERVKRTLMPTCKLGFILLPYFKCTN